MIVIFLGPPGAGKGTQGRGLAKKYGIPHIAVGDIFREAIVAENKEGKLINDYVIQGKLVPDEIVNRVVRDFLFSKTYSGGYILDGYPRNLNQAKFLATIVDIQDVKVLYFDISDELLLQRILGRYSCKKCGEIYNKYFLEPEVEGVCDVCGSSVFTYRQDDNRSVLEQRLETYKIDTYPLIDYYRSSDNFYMIDGSKSGSEIEQDIDKIIKIN